MVIIGANHAAGSGPAEPGAGRPAPISAHILMYPLYLLDQMNTYRENNRERHAPVAINLVFSYVCLGELAPRSIDPEAGCFVRACACTSTSTINPPPCLHACLLRPLVYVCVPPYTKASIVYVRVLPWPKGLAGNLVEKVL
jgi:hypothetical protein